jgi:hypothetical protein
LAAILEADHKQEIDFLGMSRGRYKCFHQDYLQIIENGNVFIGVNGRNEKQVITEDIRRIGSEEVIAQHEYRVNCVLIHENQNILWVGTGEKGQIIFEYVLGQANKWRIQTKYSNLGVE